MRLRISTFASAASLLLCLATIILWVRSYRSYDRLGRDSVGSCMTTPACRELISFSGGLVYHHFKSGLFAKAPRQWELRSIDPNSPAGISIHQEFTGTQSPDWWNQMGFFAVSHDEWYGGEPSSRTLFEAPHWSVALILLLPGLPLLIRVARSFRKLPTGPTCTKCHYNLTGNTSGVCPECGSPVAGRVGT